MGKKMSFIFWEGKQVSPGSGKSHTSKGGKIHHPGRGQEELSVSPSSSAMLGLTWTDCSRASLTSLLLWSSKWEQKTPLTDTSRNTGGKQTRGSSAVLAVRAPSES